eukprot:6479573-Amphidinium_carterae.2
MEPVIYDVHTCYTLLTIWCRSRQLSVMHLVEEDPCKLHLAHGIAMTMLPHHAVLSGFRPTMRNLREAIPNNTRMCMTT